MNDNKPIYKGGWQNGNTIRQELRGPIGDGQVTYPNGDRFNGYFHLSYASINGPAYAAEGRYDFADGSYIERAWINTDSSCTIFDLQGVFRIHRDDGPESIALFFRNQRNSFELFLAEKPYAIEWYADEQLRELEVKSYDIAEPAEGCLTLTLTLADGTRIVQEGGCYRLNNYDKKIYEPHTKVSVYLPNGDSIDHWGLGLKLLEPYDGYLTVHCAETQMCRDERWKQGTCVETQEWERDILSSKSLRLPNPLGNGETDAWLWKNGHIEYRSEGWTYDGQIEGDCPEGQGILSGASSNHKDESYVGEFHEGRAHGQGVYENGKAGIRQEGTFVKGFFQEPNAPTSPIMLHARHGHSSWSIGSQSDWEHEDCDFEAKVEELPFIGFGDIKIARIEKDCITLTDYFGNVKELHPGETVHYSAEIEGREWSDGCVYDGDDYSLDLTWTEMKNEQVIQDPLETTFEITHDREFLKHFLTRWRTLSISPEMVEHLKNSDDYYACYGYGRWLYFANPDGQSLKEAQEKLTLAANYGYVSDAFAALSEMYYEGTVETGEANHEMHTFLMYKAETEGSELAQYLTLSNAIYGGYGFEKDLALVADILQKHLEKHPDSDPIYWDLLGQAIEDTDKDEAYKCYMKSLEAGNIETYFSLVNFFNHNGDNAKALQYAEEGMAKGAVNCHRALAYSMTQEEFLSYPEAKQKQLHEEIDRGLHYAIDHYDRYACMLLASNYYVGEFGYEADTAEAIRIAKRGAELGDPGCCEFLALVYCTDEGIPEESRISNRERAKLCLQALHHDRVSDTVLEEVARAYVQNLLPQNDEEIEKRWLKKYYEQSMKEDDSPNDTGILKIYPQGFIYAEEVEQESFDSLSELGQFIDADGVDVVHYSDLLNRMSKVVCCEVPKKHVAMLVDRNGYAKDLPDNMPGTILYGHGMEMRGTMMLVLEDENYKLLPIKGLRMFNVCIQMLNAATQGLTRMPTKMELESIEGQ